MKRFALIGSLLAAVAIFFTMQPSLHAETKSEIYQSGKSEFGQDFAVGGYDAVAYQKAGAPVAGKKDYAFKWKNATWRFSSAENLEAFKSSPETYAPQYGGYCAYGLAQGYAVHGDPKQWAVVNGKLYLNYNADVQSTWQKDKPGYIKAADAQWPKVLN